MGDALTPVGYLAMSRDILSQLGGLLLPWGGGVQGCWEIPHSVQGSPPRKQMSGPKWASAEVDKPWYKDKHTHTCIYITYVCACVHNFFKDSILFLKIKAIWGKYHDSGWLEIKIYLASFELLEFKGLPLSTLQFAGLGCKCLFSVNLRLRENKLDAAWVSSVQGQTCKGWVCGHPWRWVRSQRGELGIHPPRRYWTYL